MENDSPANKIDFKSFRKIALLDHSKSLPFAMALIPINPPYVFDQMSQFFVANWSSVAITTFEPCVKGRHISNKEISKDTLARNKND